jgi:hypothetical protein
MDADKHGAGLGLPVLVAMCGALLGRNTRGGTILIGPLNLGGSFEMIPNAQRIAELAVDKQAGHAPPAGRRPPAAHRPSGRHLDPAQHRVLQGRRRRGVQGAGGVIQNASRPQ